MEGAMVGLKVEMILGIADAKPMGEKLGEAVGTSVTEAISRTKVVDGLGEM